MVKGKTIFGKNTTKETSQNPEQSFLEAYQQLCEQHGRQIVVVPVWIARDDGTFSMRLHRMVGPYQPE